MKSLSLTDQFHMLCSAGRHTMACSPTCTSEYPVPEYAPRPGEPGVTGGAPCHCALRIRAKCPMLVGVPLSHAWALNEQVQLSLRYCCKPCRTCHLADCMSISAISDGLPIWQTVCQFKQTAMDSRVVYSEVEVAVAGQMPVGPCGLVGSGWSRLGGAGRDTRSRPTIRERGIFRWR